MIMSLFCYTNKNINPNILLYYNDNNNNTFFI